MDVRRVTGILLSMILFLALGSSLCLGTPQIEAGNESRNNTQDEDTAWINAEIEDLEKKPEMQIAGGIITTGLKEVDIWVYELTPENQQFDGTMIGEWKVNVWLEQTEGGEATDEEVAFIRDQIARWKENPELRISATAVHRTEKEVILWVDERTPENQQLHRTMIDGWEIIVATGYEPSLSDTFYDILTNTPILWILAGCVFISLVIVFVKYRGRRGG